MHPLFFISKSNDALFYIYVNLFFNAFVVNKKFFANTFLDALRVVAPGKPDTTNVGRARAAK